MQIGVGIQKKNPHKNARWIGAIYWMEICLRVARIDNLPVKGCDALSFPIFVFDIPNNPQRTRRANETAIKLFDGNSNHYLGN